MAGGAPSAWRTVALNAHSLRTERLHDGSLSKLCFESCVAARFWGSMNGESSITGGEEAVGPKGSRLDVLCAELDVKSAVEWWLDLPRGAPVGHSECL